MRGRIIKIWLPLTIIILGSLIFLSDDLLAAAGKNLSAVNLFPYILNSKEGLRWACTSKPETSHTLASTTSQTANGSLLAGQIAAAQGDCTTAIIEWQLAATSGGTRSTLAHFELGRVLYSQGDLPSAIEQFRLSNASRYIHNLALHRQQSNQSAEARALFELAFAVKPDVATADQLARIYSGTNLQDQITDIWQHLASVTSINEAEHWLALAEIATLKQDWGQTSALLTQALRLSDDPYSIYLRLGRAQEKQGNWDVMIEAYQHAIELRPAASTEPYTQVGLAYARLGQYPEAMAWFDRGIAIAPNDPWPNIHAGNVAAQQGDVLEAEERLQAAVASAPAHFGALHALGAFLVKQNRPQEAIFYLEKLDTVNNCVVMRLLGEAYLSLPDTARANEISQYVKRNCP